MVTNFQSEGFSWCVWNMFWFRTSPVLVPPPQTPLEMLVKFHDNIFFKL